MVISKLNSKPSTCAAAVVVVALARDPSIQQSNCKKMVYMQLEL